MRRTEVQVIAAAGKPVARATARVLAVEARKLLLDAERILETAGDHIAAGYAKDAGEATTEVLRATYDGPGEVFACRR